MPQFEISSAELGKDVLELLAVDTQVFGSKGEARRLISSGGVSINKEKISSVDHRITEGDIINNKYLLVQKGKKNYYLIKIKS